MPFKISIIIIITITKLPVYFRWKVVVSHLVSLTHLKQPVCGKLPDTGKGAFDVNDLRFLTNLFLITFPLAVFSVLLKAWVHPVEESLLKSVCVLLMLLYRQLQIY